MSLSLEADHAEGGVGSDCFSLSETVQALDGAFQPMEK